MKSSLKNMVIVLLTITLVSGAAVSGVYILTKEPIEKAKIAKTNKAISDVMPPFDNDPSAEMFTKQIDGASVAVYPAKMGGQAVGYAIETFSNNGFGGKVSLLVGFTMDGKIRKISVLEHKETPGLGDKIEPAKSNFSVQFEGMDPSAVKLSVKKDGGDVDAITASTITSRAYVGAVQAAYGVFCDLIGVQYTPTDSVSGATSDAKKQEKPQEVKKPQDTTMVVDTMNYSDGVSGATKPDGASGATKTK